MQKITQEQLHEAAQLHKKWRLGQPGGVRMEYRDADLSGLDFSDLDLSLARFVRSSFEDSSFVGSSFVGSSFEGSSFVRSRFVRSSFEGSSFVRSRFEGSSFEGSRFVGSHFVGSSFVDSRFVDSSFEGSSFEGSRFEGSSFVDSRFEDAREDFFAILNHAAAEVPALKQALLDGRIDGSVYTGECACLVGTIANVRGIDVYTDMPEALRPNSSRPAEVLFLSIAKGQTPENNPISKIVLGWIEEWEAQQPAKAEA